MICLTLAAHTAGAEKAYDASNRRDPFVPLVDGGPPSSGSLLSVEGPDDLIIEGIAFDPAGSLVVVNGTMMREGEVVGSTKLVRAERFRAFFEIHGVPVVKEVNPTSPGEA